MVTRIRQLLEQKQLTPTQFADAIGVGRPVMSHILSERNKPSLEVVQRIIDAFPEVSMSWLLRGTGEMLESSLPSAAVTSPTAPVELAPIVPVASTPTTSPPVPLASATLVPPVPATVTPLPVPSAPEPALLASETTVEPAITAESLTSETPATLIAATPEVPPISASVVELPTPAAPKPFKAQRFVPPVFLPTQAPPTSPAAPSMASSASAVAAAVVSPVVSPPATPGPFVPAPQSAEASSTPTTLPASTVVAASPDASLLPFLGEPGKAIRRIVIFYRDGSFADYQPEQ